MDYSNKIIWAKKLLYQSKNRGCLETGLILGKFAQKYLSDMNEEDLHDFATILDQNDIDIYNWITKKVKAPSNLNSKIMIDLLKFCELF